MVARLQRRHALAHLQHDARALMAEDRGEQPLGVGARQGEVVGVADAGGLDLDQDLARAGPSRFTSMISSGFPASSATAARVRMCIRPSLRVVLREERGSISLDESMEMTMSGRQTLPAPMRIIGPQMRPVTMDFLPNRLNVIHYGVDGIVTRWSCG
jgi:hypothetical protein